MLIRPEVVEEMRPGSVIVDLAAEMGGNCPLTRKDEVVRRHGVTIVGESNLPSRMAADASRLFARNMLNFLGLLMEPERGSFTLPRDDEIIAATLLCHEGEFLQERFLQAREA